MYKYLMKDFKRIASQGIVSHASVDATPFTELTNGWDRESPLPLPYFTEWSRIQQTCLPVLWPCYHPWYRDLVKEMGPLEQGSNFAPELYKWFWGTERLSGYLCLSLEIDEQDCQNTLETLRKRYQTTRFDFER